MRAVIVGDFAQPSGGAPAVAIQSALALARRGCAVTFIHGVRESPDPRMAEAGVSVVPLGLDDVWTRSALSGAAAGLWSREAARRLQGALDALPPGPAVLHLHQWTRSLSPSAFPVLLRSGLPLVVTLHDYFVACPNGVYYRFDTAEPCRLVPLSRACAVAPCDSRSRAHKLVRLLRTAIVRRSLSGRDVTLVHVSDRGRDTIAPFLPPGLGQHRIDNPVEAEKGPPAVLPPGAPIAYVGRLTRDKGADLVAAAGHAAGVPLLFVGEGPAEADIRRLAPDATLIGWRPREEIERILRNGVRALAAPSRWFETGPLTVYEAMAAGVPPVVSVRAGAAEKVDHGETGLVVQPEVGALAAAFRDLSLGDRARTFGQEAYRRFWAAPLDADRHATATLSLYRQVLLARAAPRSAASSALPAMA